MYTMQTHPYVFKRGGEIVAKLDANGEFHSNADGAGWFTYDSLLDFFQDAGVEIHPVEYITQVAELVNALPEIDLAALQAAQAPAPAPTPTPTPAAPAPTPKPKRGRAAKAPAGVAETIPTAMAPAPAPIVPVPAPAPNVDIPQVGTPAPTTNPLMDPAVQAFLASQKAAAANNPPLPLPVPTPPAAGATTTPFTSDGNPAPVVVTATVGGVESPAAGTRKPNPITPVAPATPNFPAVQLPTRTVTDAVDAIIKTHGIVAVAAAFVQWATNGAEAAEQYGLVETAKRLRAIAAAHGMTQGL